MDACMIVSFRDAWRRHFFVKDVRAKKIPADLEARLFRKLQMLDDATTDADLRVPPSHHFEKLRGALAGWCSSGMAAEVRRPTCISTITTTAEVNHAHDQA